MEWSQTGVVLSARPHGETSAIVELFTRDRGRHLGLVRGGRGRRLRAVLQIGNSVNATWRARLEDHLGTYTLEAETYRAAKLIDDPLELEGLSNLCALAGLLPERHPYEQLYDATVLVLEALETEHIWPALMVRWEMGLLEVLGFVLDLTKCAGTGATENLIYVSPKSGRAVSAKAGEPYKDRLLNLPQFLVNGAGGLEELASPTPKDVLDGFALTGFFLNLHVFDPRGLKAPLARGRMIERISQKWEPVLR